MLCGSILKIAMHESSESILGFIATDHPAQILFYIPYIFKTGWLKPLTFKIEILFHYCNHN